MKRIAFACQKSLAGSPKEIADQILDLTNWPKFHGYGPIPGIESAEFEIRTPDIVGSRIRVKNLDGSTHNEEIVEWELDRRLQLRMGDFSPPLSYLANGFVETWEFQSNGSDTHVTRTIEMDSKSAATFPLLWLISLFLRRAISRQLQQMQSHP